MVVRNALTAVLNISLSTPDLAFRPLTVWRFCDGKPGHDNQSLGLVEALASLTRVQVIPIRLPASRVRRILQLLRHAGHRALPAPDLIVGAGHATHLPMLLARQLRAGKVVALMKPSLPLSWFDMSVVPRHDGIPEDCDVFVTEGALNAMSVRSPPNRSRGLILIGGPSRHFAWDDDRVIAAVGSIATREPGMYWTVADSRRTPGSLVSRLSDGTLKDVEFIHHSKVGADWLRDYMRQCGAIWVTEDSVSMIYEALSTQASVGVIPLAMAGQTRVAQGVRQLSQRGTVLSLDQWLAGKVFVAARKPLREAQRCAAFIIARWFSQRRTAH